ncbi:MAG: hypothetical protein M3Y53_07005, partial [Thermoproteota archaeon]|nr:hypothetical protein [Thermoproteota archaeon]
MTHREHTPQVNNDNDTEMRFSAGEEDQGHYVGGIDLGNIEEKVWAHNLVKEEGIQKSIPMNTPDLIDFVATAKAS